MDITAHLPENYEIVPAVHEKSNYELVRDWHEKFGAFMASKPGIPTTDIVELRLSLIREEAAEVEKAIASHNLVDVAKELADLLYVTYGMAAAYGLPMDAIFRAVQTSNMSKLDADGNVVRNEKGKILKGPNYAPAEPAIAEILKAHALDDVLEDVYKEEPVVYGRRPDGTIGAI